MTYRGKRVMKEDGTWHEGSASPKLLKENLRNLPGEIVTEEDADDSKAHELDPQHVVDAIAYEHGKAQRQEGQKNKTTEDEVLYERFGAPLGEKVPLTQPKIDYVRMRIIRTIIANYAMDLQNGVLPDTDHLYHVWFPENNVNNYALKHGKEPANLKRPPHLKNFKLTVDIHEWPKSIEDALEAKGIDPKRWRDIQEMAIAGQEAQKNQTVHEFKVTPEL